MAIAVQVHDNDPRALADVIAATITERGIIEREPVLAHMALLVASEEREAEARRDSWRWLNSVSLRPLDRDNDWSDL